MRTVLRIVIWIASVGWLVPTYFAISFYLSYQRWDVQHQIYHGSPGVSSFPFLAMSTEMFDIAFPWFACVLAAWIAVAVIAVTKREPGAEKKAEKK